MHRAMQVVVGLVGLTAVAAVTVLARRAQRADALEMALARELEPGMTLAEATALLQRLNLPFSVDSTAEGMAVVHYRREVARENGVSSATEQRLFFDRHERLRDMAGVATISSP